MSSGNAHIEQIQDRYAPRFDAVRRDTTRTPDWRKRRLADLWLQMNDEVKQAREEATSNGQARIRSLTRKAFGVDGMEGDAGSLAISMRDAADRVSQVNDRNELTRLLDSASYSGDEVLARAVARQAFEQRDDELLDAFASIRPEEQRAVGELREMTTDTRRSRLIESMVASAAKPPELAGMDEFACRQILEDAERQETAGQQAAALGDAIRTGFGGQASS